MPTLTVTIVPWDTIYVDPITGIAHPSAFGHMWFSTNNDVGTKPQSFGYAPVEKYSGQPWAPGGVTHNDDAGYQKTSGSHTKTIRISDEQYERLVRFGDNPESFGFSMWYGGPNNSCIDYTWKGLEVIGINSKGFEGRIMPEKNVADINKAFDEYIAKNPDSQRTLSVSGTQSPEDALKMAIGQGSDIQYVDHYYEEDGKRYYSTYSLVSIDEFDAFAASRGSSREEILAANPQKLGAIGGLVLDGTRVLLPQNVALAVRSQVSAADSSVTFVSQHELSDIRAMYGDIADDTSGLGVVPTDVYNDWQRSQLISSFNLFGTSAISEIAYRSLYTSISPYTSEIWSHMQDLGFSSGTMMAVAPRLASISSIYAKAPSYWQYQSGGAREFSYVSQYSNSNLNNNNASPVTDAPPSYFDSIVGGVNTLLKGTSFDISGTTITIGVGNTGGAGGPSLPYIGPTISTGWGCPIGIDLGSGTPGISKDALGLKSMFSSTAFFDMDGDGYKERTGWVGPDDGLLVIDLAADGSQGSDGVIDQAKELAFKLWNTEAKAA